MNNGIPDAGGWSPTTSFLLRFWWVIVSSLGFLVLRVFLGWPIPDTAKIVFLSIAFFSIFSPGPVTRLLGSSGIPTVEWAVRILSGLCWAVVLDTLNPPVWFAVGFPALVLAAGLWLTKQPFVQSRIPDKSLLTVKAPLVTAALIFGLPWLSYFWRGEQRTLLRQVTDRSAKSGTYEVNTSVGARTANEEGTTFKNVDDGALFKWRDDELQGMLKANEGKWVFIRSAGFRVRLLGSYPNIVAIRIDPDQTPPPGFSVDNDTEANISSH
jgi:hypothetical protein